MTMGSPDELSVQLREALRDEAVLPDDAALTRLDEALEELAAGAHLRRPRPSVRRPTSIAVMSLASVLLVGGAAAAAVATDTLPGPLRNVAYRLGLPVTSPGLHRAEGLAAGLQATLQAHHRAEAHTLATQLQQQLTTLDPQDRRSIESEASALLSAAGLEGDAGATTTVAPTSTTTPSETTVPTSGGESTTPSGGEGSGQSSGSEGGSDSSSTSGGGVLSGGVHVTVTLPVGGDTSEGSSGE